jgi:polar amino acid transport system permease protein
MSTVEAVAEGAGGDRSPAPSRHEPRATIALALAIISCCTFTIIPALIAFPLAGIGERRIWASNGRLLGTERVRWARLLSKIGIGLGIVVITAAIIITQWEGLKNVQETFFDWDALVDSFPTVRTGFWINVQIFMIAEVLVLIWALLLAVFRSLPGRAAAPLRWFAIGYIDLFRGLPAIVTIYMIGYGISLANLPIAKNLHDFQFGIIALTIVYGAYVAEVYRAGIESVHWSQEAAARSLGLSYGQSMQYVIAPQAIRRIIPPLLNDFIGLQKDTALLGLLGTLEGFKRAQIYGSNHSTLTSVTTLGLLFLVITIPLARFTDYLLKREQRRTQAA